MSSLGYKERNVYTRGKPVFEKHLSKEYECDSWLFPVMLLFYSQEYLKSTIVIEQFSLIQCRFRWKKEDCYKYEITQTLHLVVVVLWNKQ
jgi:hypothetical protein